MSEHGSPRPPGDGPAAAPTPVAEFADVVRQLDTLERVAAALDARLDAPLDAPPDAPPDVQARAPQHGTSREEGPG